jgi:subtilisin family serine protease/outer membrane protein assembly factor BamB
MRSSSPFPRPARSFAVRLCVIFLSVFALGRAANTTPDSPLTAKELAQGFRDHTLLAKPRASRRATADAEESRDQVRVRAKFTHVHDVRVIELDDTETVADAIARLQATGRYEFVEPDRIRHLDATPNDPSFSLQWSLNNTGQSGGVAGSDIKAPAAWDIIHDAPNVIVAVVDTGLNLTHQDLAPNLWVNPNPLSGVNDRNGANFVGGRGSLVNGSPVDDNGHGSHVAGIIGAAGNNSAAVSGVAWKVQLMAVKVFPASGSGSYSDIVAGVNYAISRGAQIINASYGETGSGGFSSIEQDVIAAAREKGILFVAAAGNEAANLDVARHYPSSYALDNIVTVGSTTRSETLASSSNYGTTVDLLAPGDSILSLGYGASNTTGTATLSGTSMAAPHVSGALALLKAQFPNDTYRQLINRLLRGTDVVARYAGKSQNGSRLNLLRALTTTTNRPFNDDFAERAHLSGSNFLVRSNNAGATAEADEAALSHGTATLWWEWTAPTTAAVRLTTSGSEYDTQLAVYTGGALNGLTLLSSNDNDGQSLTSRIDFTAQAGTTYQIAVGGKGGATGLTLLNLGTIPVNDAFATPTTLNGLSDGVTATNANCTRETGEPRILGFTGGTSLWYKWTAPRSGRFQFAAVSTDFDPLLAVYTGTSLSALTLLASSNNSGPGNSQTSSLCTIDAVSGTTYLITVDSTSSTSLGTFTLTLCDSLWQADTGSSGAAGGSLTGAPAVAPDGTIYIGSTDLSLYAFSSSGALKWSFATGGLIDTCSPAIAEDGTVYVGSNDGNLYAINPDGSRKWSHNFAVGSTVYGASNSPAIAADGTLYIKINDGYLYALNPADGSQKWRANVNSTVSYASPVIAADGTVYQGSEDKNLYAINPATGAFRWTFAADNDIYTAPAIDSAGNLYFGVINSGWFYSITSSGTQRWVYKGATAATTSSPVLSADGSTVYFAAYDKKLHAVSTGTGAVRWTHTLGDEVRASSPAIDSNGVIYVGCYDFKLYAVNPDGTRNRTWSTGNWIRSCPAIAGHTLYVGSNDHKLYAFDLGTAGPGSSAWPQYRHNARRLGRAVVESLAITAQPQSVNVAFGYPLALSVTVTGQAPLTYQWKKDGVEVPGATSATYTVASATAASSGSYTVTISGPQGTLTSNAAVVIASTLVAGRLVNLSVRTTAGLGAQTLTVGFVVSPGNAKPLLIRGIGPTLGNFGVTGVLADPQLQVFNSTSATAVETNNNWGGGATLATTFASVGAFSLATSSLDAALQTSLAAGNYTAQITGSSSATGIALAELYDLDATPAASGASRLINVSARAQVGTDANILIAGFSISGNLPKTVLIRGIGPSLTQFGVAGTLADPKLDLYRGSSVVQSNDNWGATNGAGTLSTVFTQVGAFGLANTSTRDAVLLVTLDPGTYTAQVSGVGNTTGVALIEVYEVP